VDFPSLPSWIFSDTVTLTKYDNTVQDAEGGMVPTVSSTTTGVACSVQSVRGGGTINQGRDGELITHRVYFRTDPGLSKGDLITFGTLKLSVTDTYNPVANGGPEWRADVREFK